MSFKGNLKGNEVVYMCVRIYLMSLVLIIQMSYAIISGCHGSALASSCITVHKSDPSTTSTTVSQYIVPPPRSKYYNPNYAFEPYWPDGNWVFHNADLTTKRVPGTACGKGCIEIYQLYGEICGRDQYYNRKTFKNYCELLEADCTGRQKWMIAYRGECVLELTLYPLKQTPIYTRVSIFNFEFDEINLEYVQCVNIRVQCQIKEEANIRNRWRPMPKGVTKPTTKVYNPHYGYEPYWENGDWVFKDKPLPPGVTTTSIPLVCGEECLEIYTRIGTVCGRQASYLWYQGCKPSVVAWFCSGIILDEQSEGYETFPTYCKFLDRQCRTDFDYRWIFVHPGPCVKPQTEVFRPFSISDFPIHRMTFFLTSLASLFHNYTLNHIIFETTTTAPPTVPTAG